MPKPTSPQPPGLTDEECDRIRAAMPITEHMAMVSESWTEDRERALIRAGCEAQRKVDVKMLRKLMREIAAVDESGRETVGIAHAIECIARTPEQPTTKRCELCGSDYPLYGGKGDEPCPGTFHSQPTTGEAHRD